VKINIYNQLGERIAELVNQELNAGTHSVKWSADNFSSGVYFYEMKAGEFVSTKKLLLIK
jgi:hypothetical protein